MREMAGRYHLGVSVDQVQLKNVNPPEPVQASFNGGEQGAAGPGEFHKRG